MEGRYQTEIYLDDENDQHDQQCFNDEHEAKQYLIKTILDLNNNLQTYERIVGKVYDQEEYEFILTMMLRF